MPSRRIVQTQLRNPTVIDKTMVSGLYETTAIKADSETEQTHRQSDNGDDILCTVLQQIPPSDFQVM
jgi:hypothetical protein